MGGKRKIAGLILAILSTSATVALFEHAQRRAWRRGRRYGFRRAMKHWYKDEAYADGTNYR